MRILSLGELLWDVFEHTEELGGAALNFSVHAQRLGHELTFLSAVGDDQRGARALERARSLGLSTEYVRTVAEAPTGAVTVQLDPGGQPNFTIHRPAAYDFLSLSDSDLERLAALKPNWIYYGTLHQMEPRIREIRRRLLSAMPSAGRLYDVNLRRDSYTPQLVLQLLADATVVKLNQDEVAAVADMLGAPPVSLEQFCRRWARHYGWRAICVTRGEEGCAVLAGDSYAESPGYRVPVADTVGAGDAFAAAFLHGLALGWSPARIGDFANRVGALVASRTGGVPAWTLDECEALTR